jgi:hypothetical protein
VLLQSNEGATGKQFPLEVVDAVFVAGACLYVPLDRGNDSFRLNCWSGHNPHMAVQFDQDIAATHVERQRPASGAAGEAMD